MFRLRRDVAAVAELAAHGERALRVLEGERVVALQPVELADVVERARDAALVLGLPEERQRRGQLAARLLESPRLAVQAPDARVRRASLAAQVEPPGAGEHLLERPEGLVVASERLQYVAVVVERPQAQVLVRLIALVEKLEALREELGGLRVRVARAGHVARLHVRRRGERGGPALLAVAREHLEVLLARVGALPEAQPLGDGLVVATRRSRGREADEGLALEVVLEDVLLVARERAVGEAQDVVALDQLRRALCGKRPRRPPRRPPRPPEEARPAAGWRAGPRARRRRPSPLRARGARALAWSERGDARLDRVLDGEGQLDLREPVEVRRPALVLEVVGHLEHAGVVVDAHDLLEQRRVAARER